MKLKIVGHPAFFSYPQFCCFTQSLGYCVSQWERVLLKWDDVGYTKPFAILKTTMLLGEYRHTLDDKNRVSLPAKFRKELGKKIIITRGLDRCLSVFSMADWKKFSEELTSQTRFNHSNSRAYDRFIAAGAIETDVDSAGRILIPDFLKQYGNLGSKIIVAGVRNRLELWNEDLWNEYIKSVEGDIAMLEEKLEQTTK